MRQAWRVALALSAIEPVGASAAALRAPFADLPATAPSYWTSAPCAAAPRPVLALQGVSYYTDARHSIADPARRAANRRLQRPAAAFVRQVTSLSDTWRHSAGRDVGSARCAAAWLDAWAAGDSFRSTANVFGGYRRSWYLSGLALAWLKVRGAPGIDALRAERIDAWLVRQARLIVRFYADPQRARDARNNHGDWAALAVAAAAVAANDELLFAWAESRFRANLAEVTPAGDLPLETERGRRALHYHLFALTPLMLMSRLEQANQRSFDATALQRLEAFVRASVEEPGRLERLAGVAQEPLGVRIDPSELVWAALSAARPGPRLKNLLEAGAPLRDPRSGGDVRVTWGMPPALVQGPRDD